MNGNVCFFVNITTYMPRLCTIFAKDKINNLHSYMNKRIITLCVSVAVTLGSAAQMLPYQNPKLSAEERAADLCSRLTLKEKAAIMRNGSPAIKRLGIPQFEWWSEALHGVARNGFATVFPNTTGMASSFDDALLERIYTAVSDEARAKNNIARHEGAIKKYQGLSIWTPNINIFRDPRWGRGQETYGEDPYLTTRMGLAVVRGLQGPEDYKYRKLLACAKHFAVHSGPEWNRHSFNIENLPERDLWETYLPAFKSLVQQGHVAEVMCAYQAIDGQPCCANTRYLQQILRNEWGFKGLVVSDCGAIGDFFRPGRHNFAKDAGESSAKAVIAGTDVECGGNYAALPDAVKAGQITEEQINTSVKRLLKARFELGDFDDESVNKWEQIPESVIASQPHKQLALDMARESMVLLKNDGILPLAKQGQKIVVVGPNAADSTMMWGNYNGYPTETVTILKGIKNMVPGARYVGGCGVTRNEEFASRYNEIVALDGKPGLTVTYWNNEKMEGEPVTTQRLSEPVNLSNGGATVFAPGVNLEHFSARLEGTFRPTRTESLRLRLANDDLARLIVNGDTIVESWKWREKVSVFDKELKVEAGKDYHIQIDYVQQVAMAVLQFDLGALSNMPVNEFVKNVGDADVVVFVGGISPRLEGEEMSVKEPGFKGGDRTDIELPEAQRRAIAALHAAGKKIVYVNCSGSAIGLVPEDANCDAVLQAWYGGERGGQAVAEILFGDVNPSGKLPLTFYKNVNQLPDYEDYRMEGRTYRYFHGEPLYPFGYGLSYTTFNFGKPKFDKKSQTVTVAVKNTGKMDGTEVVQLYLKRVDDKQGPIKTLRGYQRVAVKQGESQTATIKMNREDFETWDAQTNTMRVVPGKYQLMVGSSSRQQDLQTIEVNIK